MKEMEENMCAVELFEGFRFHEQLVVAVKEIEELYTPFEGSVFRTFINNPPAPIDYTPQALREPDGKALVKGGLSQEEYDKLTRKQKKGYISDRTLSVNESREDAIGAAAGMFKRLKKMLGTEDAEAYIEEDRGKYVGEIVLKPGQALISKFVNGHGEIILSQEVKLEDIEIRNITEYKYEDE